MSTKENGRKIPVREKEGGTCFSHRERRVKKKVFPYKQAAFIFSKDD